MSNARATNNKVKRVYKRITPEVITEHKAQSILQGNDSAAVRVTDSNSYIQPGRRGFEIQQKANKINAVEYIDNKLQVIGCSAIDRVEQMVQSENEQIATKNSHFVIDHIRGKALQRNLNATIELSPESILD